jgi:hypothetical protein
MDGMVGDAELQVHHGGNPATGPYVAPEAIGLGAAVQQLGQMRQLAGGQPTGCARGGLMAQGLRATFACTPQPFAARGFADTQGLGNPALRPALLLVLPGLETPCFFPVAR